MRQSVFKPRRRKNGKLHVSKIWHGCFRIDEGGADSRISLHTTDKQVAEQKLRQIVLEKQREAAGLIQPSNTRSAGKIEIKKHVDHYLKKLELLGRDSEYTKIIDWRISKLCVDCKWVFVADITPKSFEAWQAANASKAAKTLNEYFDTLRGFLNWMVETEQISVFPLKPVKRIDGRGKERRLRRAFTFEESQRLLGVAGPRKAAYLVAIFAGLRRAELAALQWGDVHLGVPSPYLIVRAATAKNRKEELLPLHADVIAELRPLSAGRDNGETVFPQVPSMEIFRSDLKKAGIDFLDGQGRRADFHALRKTLATNMGIAGVPSRVAQAMMRHSDPMLTNKIYTDVSQLPLTAAMKMLPSFENTPVIDHTKKYTKTPGFPAHWGASPVTVGYSWGNDQTVANKGESHDLALCVTGGHGEENGAPARTRT